MAKASAELTTRPANPFAVLQCTSPHTRLEYYFNSPLELAQWANNELGHWAALSQKAIQGKFASHSNSVVPAKREQDVYNDLYRSANNASAIEVEDLLTAFRVRFPMDLRDVDPDTLELQKSQAKLMGEHQRLKNELEQVDKLEQRLREKLFFQPSRRYWARKAIAHWVGVGIGGLVISGVVAGLLIYAVRGGFNDLLTVAQAHFAAMDHWGYVVFFTLPTIAIFYALRPVMKFFTFSLQRAGDAGERATMVMTYLALTEQENRRPTESERLLILGQLFRPGPGDTAEDTGNETLLEQLISSARSTPKP